MTSERLLLIHSCDHLYQLQRSMLHKRSKHMIMMPIWYYAYAWRKINNYASFFACLLIWCPLLPLFQWVEAREKFQKAAELISAEHRMRKTMWGQFWSAHQRFFKYLCISAKVKHCVKLARDAVKNGKVSSVCVCVCVCVREHKW